jgi:hypothetical protein
MDKGLRFRGASIHSQEDIDAAVVALVGYIDAVQGSSTARSESDATWLQEAPHDVAAELSAFLYTQYGLIYRSQASDKQLVAFLSQVMLRAGQSSPPTDPRRPCGRCVRVCAGWTSAAPRLTRAH